MKNKYIRRLAIGIITASITAMAAVSYAKDAYYFRLRPSITILNQETFAIRIEGDRRGVVGNSFHAKAMASAPRETLQFSITSGELPPGLSIDASSGEISGRPQSRGAFSATVTAKDAFDEASANLGVTIFDPLEIASVVSPYATVGKPYSATFSATGGDDNRTWEIFGTPPPGLSFSSGVSQTAVLSGTPSEIGISSGLSVRVSDGTTAGVSTAPFSIAVAEPLVISGEPHPHGTGGVSYLHSFGASGGHAPLTWSVSSGALPTGISLNGPTISGTPSAPASQPGIVVRVTDAAGNTADSTPFSLTISSPLAVTGSAPSFGTIGTSYSFSLGASGGHGDYGWTSVGSPLPHGLSIYDGRLSGVPTTADKYTNIILRVTDGVGRTADSPPFTITINDPLSVDALSERTGTVGVLYEGRITANGGDGNYAWTLTSGTLPPGLALSDGVISGEPTVAGTWSNIVFRITDGNSRSIETTPISIRIYDALTLTGAPPTYGTVDLAYSAKFTASGGNGDYTWSLENGSLPSGMAFADGVISGLPSKAEASSDLVVKVSDSGGRTALSKPFTITVHDVVAVSGTAQAIATIGVPYAASLAAAGGDGNYTWSMSSGALPPGLTFLNGTISGVPNKVGTAPGLVAKVSDGLGRIAETSPFSITVHDQLLVGGTPSTVGTVNTAYSATFAATGGGGTYAWSLASGTLPTGLTLANGKITGTPTNSGTSPNIVIRVSDAHGRSAETESFAITVHEILSISGTPPPTATVNTAYSAMLTASGGGGNYTWSLASGILPSGIVLSDGRISGTPTKAGISPSIVIRATDSVGRIAEIGPFSITVHDALVATGAPPATATVNSAYSAVFAASGGDGNYTWSLASGQTPPGMTFANGKISGTPTTKGSWSGITVRVVDGIGRSTLAGPFSITVHDPLDLAGIPPATATIGTTYAATFSATGGDGSYNWSIASGILPSGLTLSGGTISGAPTQTGTWSNLSVGVADGAGRSARSNTFSISVHDTLKIAGTPSAVGTANSPYAATFAASGGNGVYSWAIVKGSLPPGLTLSNGSVSGTPSVPGTWPDIVVRVSDGVGRTVQSDPFSITIHSALSLAGTAPTIGTINSSYSATFIATGGGGVYTWSLASGSLPTGLTLVAGAITGSPSVTGTWPNIAVRVTDGNGRTAQTSPFSITIHDNLSISGSAASAIVNTSYSATFAATGGSGSYSWSLASGTLPNGLSLSNGKISGTPTKAGTFSNLIVRVTDSHSRSAQVGPFSISIYDTVSVSGAAPSIGTIGSAYGATFSASGGNGSYTWSVSSGTLPSGLTMSNGRITGTPSAAGTWANIILLARDSLGSSAMTSTFSITVSPPVSISGTFPTGTVGTSYSYQFAASGGRTPYAWAISSGTLPSGLSQSAGSVSGTPSATGTTSGLVMRVTDADGRTAYTPSLSLTINNPPVTAGTWAFSPDTHPTFGSWAIPQYNTLTIEVFGAGGAAGQSTTPGGAGGGGLADVPGYGRLIAYGGQGGPGSGIAYGGASSGGDINLTGGNGTPYSDIIPDTHINQGGASGGVHYGGGNFTLRTPAPPGTGYGYSLGFNGSPPGGGGSGCLERKPGIAGSRILNSASGAGGGYTRKTFTRGQSNAPLPGQSIPYQIAVKGYAPLFTPLLQSPTKCGGDGAHGLIRFTVN